MSVVKIVILNWNGREHLSRFLPLVVANAGGADVIVADNGSHDDSCAFIEENFPSVKVIRLGHNYGYAGGYNRALASPACSGADYWVLLNSDVETPSGWLEPLIRKMKAESAIAFLAPKILSYDDRGCFEYAGACGGFIDGLGYPFCRGRIMGHIEKDTGQYDDARDVFWASGACLVARSDAFVGLGGFDGDFFAHMEEIDLCWRAQLSGWRVAVEPKSHVYHLGGGTLEPSPFKTYLNYRNNLAMLYKNLSGRSKSAVIFLRMLLDGLSALIYLITGRVKLFRSVFKAHKDYRKMRPGLREKRQAVQASRIKQPVGIWRGLIVVRYVFGIKRFGKLL